MIATRAPSSAPATGRSKPGASARRPASASTQNEARTIAEETLPAAQSAFESVRQGYRQGKFDYLEVLDAQRTLFGVRRQQIQALSRYYRARVQVERLVATPLEELQ